MIKFKRNFSDEFTQVKELLTECAFNIGYYEGIRKTYAPNFVSVEEAESNAEKVSLYKLILPLHSLNKTFTIDLCSLFYRVKKGQREQKTICLKQLVDILEQSIKYRLILEVSSNDIKKYRDLLRSCQYDYYSLKVARDNHYAHRSVKPKPSSYTPKNIDKMFKVACEIINDIDYKINNNTTLFERSRSEIEEIANELVLNLN